MKDLKVKGSSSMLKNRAPKVKKISRLVDGDSVTVVKDLKVKGSSSMLKNRAPKVKKISRLV
ncbi:hypothetical protein CQA20_29680, partial [Klebsiella pneumoniae]